MYVYMHEKLCTCRGLSADQTLYFQFPMTSAHLVVDYWSIFVFYVTTILLLSIPCLQGTFLILFFFFQENVILFFLIYFILLFNFTILYWFCHISTWIRHRYTRVPHPEPFLLPPCTIPLGRPSAPALSIQYHASNLDWWPFLILTWLFTQQIIQ